MSGVYSVTAGDSGAPLGELPAYRVHKAKALGYVRLKGRMVYLGRAGSVESHEQYRRTVAEWMATGRVRSGQGGESAPSLTVSQLAEQYLRWARTYYLTADGQPSPGLGPVEAAARAMTALYGLVNAEVFGPVALRAVRHQMIARGLCRNVINQRVACVKRIFRWGVAEELVPPPVLQALSAVDPLKRGRSGARETPPVCGVQDAHVNAVLPFLPPTLRAMVELQRLTGMRSGELCILRTCDLDRSGDVWVYRPQFHKNTYRGQDRPVYLGPRAQEILRPMLLDDRPEAFVFSPARAQRERRAGAVANFGELHEVEPGFPCTRSVYNARSYHRSLRYGMKAATRQGLLRQSEYWHPHQLRHSHATSLRRRKGVDAARILLGHKTISQTLEYADDDDALAIALAREVT